ncbi:MAG: transcriptional regulator, MarR family [Bacillales bacterium]|jgi:DNA-binding MarR family transcriptional regulator|nr:transcriptional regulator, MarR family [Bacillales bacterium]
MNNNFINDADAIAMFCRLQLNIKKDLPIRSSEMGVLIFIQKHGDKVTPLLISNFFNIAKPTVTTMVNSLIKKEYLVKTPSEIDGRSYTISLTEKGLQLVETTHIEYFKSMGILKERMGQQDFDSLIKLINKANLILSEGKRK